jgi:hypothetical protein
LLRQAAAAHHVRIHEVERSTRVILGQRHPAVLLVTQGKGQLSGLRIWTGRLSCLLATSGTVRPTAARPEACLIDLSGRVQAPARLLVRPAARTPDTAPPPGQQRVTVRTGMRLTVQLAH